MSYKDRLPSREEETESIQRYMGFYHANINLLCELDIDKMMTMNSKGWNIDIKSENLEELINDFVNIYGDIYSNGDSNISNVYRGTTNKEAIEMVKGQEVQRVISTSNDLSIAKTFCEYGDAAIIRINVANGLPCLRVNDYREEHRKDESEVIILPFSKVKSSKCTTSWDEYKYYDVYLEKEDLPDITDEELQTLKRESIENFDHFIEREKECAELRQEQQIIYERFSRRGLDLEDRKYLRERQNLISDKINSIREENEPYKTKFQRMIKGLCKQREKDKDQEKEDKIAEFMKELEEKKRAEEQGRLAKLELELAELKSQIPTDLQDVKQNLEQYMGKLLERVGRLKNVASDLGVSNFNIVSSGAEFKELKERIIQEIDRSSELCNNGEEKTKDERHEELKEYKSNIIRAKEMMGDLPELTEMYIKASTQDIKYNLNQKVQDLIYRSTIVKLQEQKNNVMNEKENFVKRLLGIEKLKASKFNNIDAKIRLASVQRTTNNPENSVNEMLQEIYDCAYKYYGGELTEEMLDMEDAIRHNFTNVANKDTLNRNAISRTENRSLAILGEKNSFLDMFSNKKKIGNLEAETARVRYETIDAERGKIASVRQNLELPNSHSKIQRLLSDVSKEVKFDREDSDGVIALWDKDK